MVGTARPSRHSARSGSRTRADWLRWYRSWEAQQDGFNRNRERRFATMFDILAASAPARFRALDLGAGPGSLSVRLLARFPGGQCVAVDRDAVLRRIGLGAHGTVGGRLTWVDADLGTPGWDRALPPGKFDAALSTTALHWLDPPRLLRLYSDLARRLKRGGVLLNGDRLPWAEDEPALAHLAERIRAVRFLRTGDRSAWSSWTSWWSTAKRDPVLRPLFSLKEASPLRHGRGGDPPLSTHVRALRRAGFRTVEVVWRDLEDGILFARR